MSKHQEIICVTAPIRTEGYLPLTGNYFLYLNFEVMLCYARACHMQMSKEAVILGYASH